MLWSPSPVTDTSPRTVPREVRSAAWLLWREPQAGFVPVSCDQRLPHTRREVVSLSGRRHPNLEDAIVQEFVSVFVAVFVGGTVRMFHCECHARSVASKLAADRSAVLSNGPLPDRAVASKKHGRVALTGPNVAVGCLRYRLFELLSRADSVGRAPGASVLARDTTRRISALGRGCPQRRAGSLGSPRGQGQRSARGAHDPTKRCIYLVVPAGIEPATFRV